MADTRKQNQPGNTPERQGNQTGTGTDRERQNQTGTTGTEPERKAGQNPRRGEQGSDRGTSENIDTGLDRGTSENVETGQTGTRTREEGI